MSMIKKNNLAGKNSDDNFASFSECRLSIKVFFCLQERVSLMRGNYMVKFTPKITK